MDRHFYGLISNAGLRFFVHCVATHAFWSDLGIRAVLTGLWLGLQGHGMTVEPALMGTGPGCGL